MVERRYSFLHDHTWRSSVDHLVGINLKKFEDKMPVMKIFIILDRLSCFAYKVVRAQASNLQRYLCFLHLTQLYPELGAGIPVSIWIS